MGCNHFKPDMPSTICWDCQNACGGCSWSKYRMFQPVKGWEVIPTDIHIGNGVRVQSYVVLKCPQFKPDKK